MTIPANASIHPAAPASHASAEPAPQVEIEQAVAKPTPKGDSVTISASAKQALAQENNPSPVVAAAQQAMETSKAQQAGHALQQQNPRGFKQADINGNGKLSAEEARAAGLIS